MPEVAPVPALFPFCPAFESELAPPRDVVPLPVPLFIEPPELPEPMLPEPMLPLVDVEPEPLVELLPFFDFDDFDFLDDVLPLVPEPLPAPIAPVPVPVPAPPVVVAPPVVPPVELPVDPPVCATAAAAVADMARNNAAT